MKALTLTVCALLAMLPSAFQKVQPLPVQMAVVQIKPRTPVALLFVYDRPITNCWLQWSTNLLMPVTNGFPLVPIRWITNYDSWHDASANDFGMATNSNGQTVWVLTNFVGLRQCFFRVRGHAP